MKRNENEKVTDITEIKTAGKKEERKQNIERLAEKAAKARNRKKAPLSRPMLIVILVFLFIAVYVITDFSVGGILSEANGKFMSVLTQSTTESFNVKADGDSVSAFKPYGSGYLLLADTGISFSSADGKELTRQMLTYSNSAIYSSENKIIVFDRGGTSYSIFRNKNLYTQKSTDYPIVDAAVSNRDNYAIAVTNENSECILYGFNGRGDVIYQWNCPDGYISDIAMNHSGSKVAVSVINSVNAVLTSSVYILDFNYDSEYAVFEYEHESVTGLKFLTSRRIQVITDKNVYTVKGKNQTVAYEYGSADLCFTSVSENRYTAVITNAHTHDDTYMLNVFGKYGVLRYSVELSGKITGVSAGNKSIAVLYDDKTETYSFTGKQVGLTQDINYNDDIVINGNYLFVLSSESIKRFSAYGTSSAVYTYEDTSSEL